jgi:hypothetical protein
MTLLTGGDFFALFTTFEHTAYRLEVRERYGIAYEDEPVRQFLAGESVDRTYMRDWLTLIAEQRRAGKRIERVRVVHRPHSDYTRFGLWLCQFNTEAGEDIRYLNRDQAAGLPGHDYWIFDSSRLYVLHFDASDDLLGAELVADPATVVRHNYWRDAAWHYAVPHAEYVKMTDSAVEHPTGT